MLPFSWRIESKGEYKIRIFPDSEVIIPLANKRFINFFPFSLEEK